MHLRLSLCVLFACAAAQADTFEGKVLGVVSGDVLSVDREGTPVPVRLYGVDAPETGQEQSDAAYAFVREQALDKQVTVEVLTQDNQEHAVANVTLPDGVSLNLAVMEKGLAWWDEPNAPEAKSIKSAAAEALRAKTGLWAGAPLAPWDFRKTEGLERIEYSVEAKPEPVEEKREEVPLLKASGEPMPPVDLRQPPPPPANFDYTTALVQHAPRIATDPSGKPLGITANNISQIPYAGMIGLRDGDIVSGVNGQPINSMDFNYLQGLYNQFKDASQLNVSVIRNGQTINIPIQLR